MYLISFLFVSFNHVPHIVQRNYSEKINLELILNTEVSAVSSELARRVSYLFCKPFVAKIVFLGFICSLFSS